MVLRKLFVLLSAFLLLGCIGSGQGIDPVNAAKASGQVQAFLSEHPNAKIVAVLLAPEQVSNRSKEYPDCGGLPAQSMYQVTFDESGTNAVAFISADKGQAVCVVVSGSGKSASPSATASAPTPTAVSPSAQASIAPGVPSEVISETKAEVSGEQLVEYRNEKQGYRVLKPSAWDAEVVEDSYLLVKENSNTDALIWPIKLSGEYARMNGLDLGNYIIGLIKDNYEDFKVENIHVAKDKSSMEVIATVPDPEAPNVMLKVVMTTFVGANGNGLLAGYEAPVGAFDQKEAVLRKIVASYAPIVTDATKAAVGSAPSGGSVSGGTSVQLTPFASGDGGFTFNAPSGWKIESLGQCSTKSMAAYDPQNYIRRVFAINTNTIAMPVRGNTAESVATEGLPALTRYVAAYGSVSNVQVVPGSRQPYPATQGLAGIVDAAIFDITLTIDGKPAKGQVGTYIYDPSNGALGAAYLSLAGAITEPEAFDALIGVATPTDARGPLGKSVGSFLISQSYADACSASSQADISRRTGDISRTLSETSDIVTGGYEERSRVNDRIAEKWSDTTLGVDRVYNPDSNEVYQVPNDFYANYDINRQSFEQQNLQQLTPDQWNDYAPLDGQLNIR
ncbi:hypothetical protein HYV43_04400 [Candidatus Micrarchaeota archaeon]|nr:hypothetical protein [Candidatus Micrarchaeota archaeon]